MNLNLFAKVNTFFLIRFPIKVLPIICFFVFPLFQTTLAESSSDASSSPATGSHDTAAPQKGGKKGEKTGDLPEWFEIQTQLTNIQARITATEDNIAKLLEQKQHLKNNTVELKKVVDELIKEHNSLKNLIEEFEKKNSILKYRYPERGTKDKRSYQKMEIQSLEDMEIQYGTEGRIKRNLEIFNRQYGAPLSPKEIKTKEKKKEISPIEEPLIIRK